MTSPTNDDSERERSPSPPDSGWGPPQQPQFQPSQAQPQPAKSPEWAPPAAAPAYQPIAAQLGQWDQPTQQYPSTGSQPPAQSGSDWATQQQPAQSGSQWPASQPPAQSGSQWPAPPPPAQSGTQRPTEQLPQQQPYGGGSPDPWGGRQRDPAFAGPPSKKSNRKLFAIIAAILALVLVGGGLFFFLSGEDITYEGRDIVEPEKVLGDAESRLDGIVEARNGALNDQTSCYFVVKNADTTDIEDRLVCGPVLFVDGDQGQSYLTFPLEGSAGDGDARLAVAAEPDSPEPAALASPDLLRRPDGNTPPEGSGGLAVPEPPRAEAGTFTVIPSEGTDLESTPATARIGSPTMSIDLTAIGEPERYGQGDEARRPAEGEKFVAFEITSGAGEVGPIGEFSVAVQIDEDDPTQLPDDADLSGGPVTLAISVPEDTEDVHLVVADGTIVQRLSLTTGEPDPDNIAVWQRTTRSQSLTFSQSFSVRQSQPGFVTEDFPCTLIVDGVFLTYFAGPNADRAPSAPSQAFLDLSGVLDISGQQGQVAPVFWSLTLPDGTVLPAFDLNDDPDLIDIFFEVPANFTEGSVNFGGVNTNESGLTFDFLGAVVAIPIAIPTD